MVKPTLIDLNLIELKYYPFLISFDKRNGSCNVLSPKTCVPKEIKNIDVKSFIITTNKNKAKTMLKHIYVIANTNLIVESAYSNQKWNSKTCQ